MSFLLCSFLYAQQQITTLPSFWSSTRSPSSEQELRVTPNQYQLYGLNLDGLSSELQNCKKRENVIGTDDLVLMRIPLPDGKTERFGFFETPVMEPALQAKYPNIRTYTAQGIDDPRKTIKMEIGPRGLQAMIFTPEGNTIISPAYEDELAEYIVFRKQDLSNEPRHFRCGHDDFNHNTTNTSTTSSIVQNPTGTELRTYRLALGTTGEYTSFHGGTKELALAAVATSMNRINGIYERDFTITMVLVANTDTLIYLDSETDPYTNNDLGAVLGENQLLCDSLIGADNYDIGHVFGTAGGGLAGVGVVCGGVKAWGATGLGNPSGDFFDVDYASHEFGHQFGAGHTFNECGGQAGQAYEPGSGVTIMAYAGLCGSSNLQSNSIDQFHVASYDQVIAYSQTANGNSCPLITETGNTPPVVEVDEGGFYIPYNTPFELTGSATDVDGDSLTYCWEQFDLGPSVRPDSAVGTAPLFRSWRPVNHPTRIFPRIEDLVNNTSTIGELLPQFGRELNFRMTVRDNAPLGGGVDYEQITFQVADSSGNFRVLQPNGGQFWIVGALQTVNWDVANSDQFPVNCQRVNIWLSEDGGFTYPHLIAANRDNTGSALVTVPNITGDQIRIKVKAADNIFFDISNNNFSILPALSPDFTMMVDQATDTICGAGIATFEISLDSILGFAESINLSVPDPIGSASFTFNANDVSPPAEVTLSVTNVEDVAPGDYTFTLQANGGGIVKNFPLTLKVREEMPNAVSLLSPFNGTTNVSEDAVFNWNATPFASTYTVEVSDSPTFDNLIYSESDITETTFDPDPDLIPNSIYFWRARVANSTCGAGDWSNTFSFQTVRSQCVQYSNEGATVAITSAGTPTVYSEIEVTQDYQITDLDVLNLEGVHTWVGDLRMTLISPVNDSTLLFGNICGDNDDFSLNFDDDATETEIPCPPTTGETYQPVEALSVFNGSSPLGIWRLKIEDTANQDGGEVQNWNLHICGPTIDDQPATVDITPDSVNFGAVLVIDSDNLLGTCSDGASGAAYQITSLPAYGNLFLNGIPLSIGSTFTQGDIDNMALSYEHEGGAELPDQFGFILTCSNGSYIGGLVYNITVLNPVTTDDVNEGLHWRLFPNPTNSTLTIELGEMESAVTKIQLIDVLGRVVFQQKVERRARQQFDLQQLTAGIYTCQLLSGNERVVGTKKLVVTR
ncbi:MAG: reprolysin-like metallopeptidase [Bacteroidota bacterium]